MAKAVQLPSGNWNVKVFAGYDATGKRQYKSFTEPTERKANLAALEWQEHYKEISNDSSNMTLDEAISKYIETKSNILSPSTIVGYEVIRKKRLQPLMQIKLSKLTNESIQAAINAEAKEFSPKSVANTFGLLSAVLYKYRPGFKLDVSLPQKQKYIGKSLTEEQIGMLLKSIVGDRAEIAILLALWLGLRRSEIIALKWDDIDFKKQTIRVDEAMVLNKDNEYVVKGTKTYSSARLMYAPKYIMDKLVNAPHESEYVVNMHPTSILYRLRFHCQTLGIPYVRLHDLRHTMASVGLSLNIADKYMMERGGWSNVQTMKKIYQHTQESGRKTADIAIDSYFEKLLDNGKDGTCNTLCNTD